MISIGFITSRKDPKFEWFFSSLENQLDNSGKIEIIVIDHFTEAFDGWTEADVNTRRENLFSSSGGLWGMTSHYAPKPNVWSGKYRTTKQDWWSKSNSSNSFLCLARGETVCCVDDRCVLDPGWLDAVREAMAGNYAVCGSYSKHSDLKVENGIVKNYGQLMGQDHRDRAGGAEHFKHHWFFGCTFALPLEWALQVNGFEELLDGLGAEDTQFGSMLRANGFEMKYDPRMRVLQDRTPGECGPEMKKTSKRRFDHDKQAKDYKAIERFYGQKQSQHPINLREIRAKVLSGEPFPHHGGQPSHDWFDGQPIKDFE